MECFDIGRMCEYSRLTVNTAMETVDSMKQYEDLYSSRGGGLEASLDLHAKMSLVMTLQCEREVAISIAQNGNNIGMSATQVDVLGSVFTEPSIKKDLAQR